MDDEIQLIEQLKALCALGPIPAIGMGSNSVGKTMQKHLGITHSVRGRNVLHGHTITSTLARPNSSGRTNLFACVPDWSSSVFKSSKELVSHFGKEDLVRGYHKSLFCTVNSKSENRIGYFKTELVDAISPKYFNNKRKTTSLLSLSSILNLLLPDSQPYKNLFSSVEKFMKSLDQENWALEYVYWELALIKELGFDPYLEQFSKDYDELSFSKTVEIDNVKYKLPNFLLKKREDKIIDNQSILIALTFTRNLLNNKFFLPNNLNLPKARIILENYFN